MKIIIIGLGNFGRALALNLTDNGHEVFGIDREIKKVNALKDHLSHVVCIDATNEEAYKILPMEQAELAIVAIGENEGASILATAILKRFQNKNLRIISRSLSDVHDTILEAMGVDEIVHPEQDAAFRLTKRISFNYALDYFQVNEHYAIAEVKCPKLFEGKKLKELELAQKYRVSLITLMQRRENYNDLDRAVGKKVAGLVTGETILKNQDILVLFGSNKSIEVFVKEI